jgi:hypothetical protein
MVPLPVSHHNFALLKCPFLLFPVDHPPIRLLVWQGGKRAQVQTEMR